MTFVRITSSSINPPSLPPRALPLASGAPAGSLTPLGYSSTSNPLPPGFSRCHSLWVPQQCCCAGTPTAASIPHKCRPLSATGLKIGLQCLYWYLSALRDLRPLYLTLGLAIAVTAPPLHSAFPPFLGLIRASGRRYMMPRGCPRPPCATGIPVAVQRSDQWVPGLGALAGFCPGRLPFVGHSVKDIGSKVCVHTM